MGMPASEGKEKSFDPAASAEGSAAHPSSENIIVFVDGSEPGDKAFGHALRYKRDEDTLHVVYVARTINHWSPGIRFANLPREMIESANKETRKVGKHIVDAYMTTLHKKKIPHCKIDVLSPDPQQTEPMAAVYFINHNHITHAFVGARGTSFVGTSNSKEGARFVLSLPTALPVQDTDKVLGSFSP